MANLLSPDDFASSPEVIRDRQRKYLRWFRPGWKVLDVGCGPGVFLELLKEAGALEEGIELDETAVRKTRRHGLNCHQGNARDFLRGKDQAYDGIFCSNFLEHFHPEEVFTFLRLFARALKADGILILIGPNARSHQMLTETFWLDPTHVRFYPNLFLSRALEKLDFEILESGDDPDTRPKPQNLLQQISSLALRFQVLRWFFGEGDEIYLVARRMKV